MRQIAITIILMAATLMSSCGVYNRYERPADISVSETYRDMDLAESDSSNLAQLSWKELFTDPYLQALIEEGLVNNTGLRIARLRIEQAEATLQSSRLAYLPSVNLSAEGSMSSFAGATPSKAYTLASSASWEIDIFGKLTNAQRGAKAAIENSIAYEQAVRTGLDLFFYNFQ